ncbi:hypothetical protein GCM10012284_45150 [Mangrovihabitans endophyticus]|uniref:Uncharacterized protein n=2 Tax=Mangrovihabitans endophyticus TaxID=1751298 RepID=A0A8J3C455_9ACTN|nr:hypothetical protein GCM10012284_45150 [Mangrovihabitans endophyticus]
MSTPTIAPLHRDPADVAPADSYHKADRVWVYRGGWHAGIIESSSALAVTVTYRPGENRGTGVDTFMPSYVTARADEDPLDRPAGRATRRGSTGQPFPVRMPTTDQLSA